MSPQVQWALPPFNSSADSGTKIGRGYFLTKRGFCHWWNEPNFFEPKRASGFSEPTLSLDKNKTLTMIIYSLQNFLRQIKALVNLKKFSESSNSPRGRSLHCLIHLK